MDNKIFGYQSTDKKIVFDNILVAGGRPPSKKWFSKVAKNKVIYCADSGIDVCYKSKMLPKVVVGDMDSCSKEARMGY